MLNYVVTSNHIHLLVIDSEPEVIPRSLQLIAGRTGQEFNQRKERKGTFWEDRYHATAVEGNEHLIRCLVYIEYGSCQRGKPPDRMGDERIQRNPEAARPIRSYRSMEFTATLRIFELYSICGTA